MTSNPGNFYATTAQVIPVLLLALGVETGFVRAVMHWRGLSGPAGTTAAFVDKIAGKVSEPVSPVGLGAAIVRVLLRVFLVAPTRISNALVVVGSLLLAISAEAVAIASLVFEPKGTAQSVIIVGLLAVIGLLLLETFAVIAAASLSANPAAMSVVSVPTFSKAGMEPGEEPT